MAKSQEEVQAEALYHSAIEDAGRINQQTNDPVTKASAQRAVDAATARLGQIRANNVAAAAPAAPAAPANSSMMGTVGKFMGIPGF